MEEPILTLKPNMLNAIFPVILANLFYAALLSSLIYGMTYVFGRFNIIDIPGKFIIALVIFLSILIFPTCFYLLVLNFTSYDFFPTRVSKEFNFLVLKKHSVPYNQITDIVTDITLWDRVSKAGNIVLHTAEEKSPNLVLRYIKEPEQVEEKIYSIIRSTSKQNPSQSLPSTF